MSSSSVHINDLRAAAGLTPLPTEGGGRKLGQKLLRGRERAWNPGSSQLPGTLAVRAHPDGWVVMGYRSGVSPLDGST